MVAAFPTVPTGAFGMIEHPKVDKTSARRTIARHAQHFKNGAMDDGEFDDKIKHAHKSLMGF